ncbi:hypothetical protein niasHS_008692 [Heterodera schachtii]|uniref:Uncharacterized protein n=1 Tax=Heterodera schachtii TaxID=97005 RepID=A0ABD2JAZ4_HETSC
MAFGRGHPFTVKVWHNGQWLRDFETEQDGNGILYKKLNTRQWTGFEDNALIRFQYENGMVRYAIYDSSKQKNYLAIDPEQWLQLYPNDVITFKCNVRNGQQVLGTATVELLREVGESTYDLDFSQGYRHYFRGVHGVIY